MEEGSLRGGGSQFYPYYIFCCVSMHLFLSLCYCLKFDIFEANATVFLLKPGTISLFFLFIPIRKLSVRTLVVFISIIITFTFNQWHLAVGNKIIVLCLQLAWFMACLSMMSVRKTGWRLASILLFLVCTVGVTRQSWLEKQFNTAGIYIVDDGISCGANGHCFQYVAAKKKGLDAERQLLFSSEDYVNIYYSYPEGIPAVNFDGTNGDFAQYLLCDGRLNHVKHAGRVICNRVKKN